MNYNKTEMRFASSDGIHTIYAEIYTPKTRTARGIVQLAHGMIDHTGRYLELADYLCSEGYIFAGHHHLGHGLSVAKDDDYGFFAAKGGVDYVIADMHTMNRYLRDTFPTLPLVLFGHSMGSFITRLYVNAHPHSAKAVIIHGTGRKNPLLPLGRAVAGVIGAIHGPRHRSGFITKVAFGAYNKRFPKEEGENAWLTRELSLVADRPDDKFTNFIFTVSGYKDLFRLIAQSNSKAWFRDYPKELPTLIVSGDMDPVGDYGKGVEYVYKQLILAGHNRLTLKMYEGARHELFKEINRDEVFSDLVGWIESVTK